MGPYVHNIKHTLWDVNMIVTLIGGLQHVRKNLGFIRMIQKIQSTKWQTISWSLTGFLNSYVLYCFMVYDTLMTVNVQNQSYGSN